MRKSDCLLVFLRKMGNFTGRGEYRDVNSICLRFHIPTFIVK